MELIGVNNLISYVQNLEQRLNLGDAPCSKYVSSTKSNPSTLNIWVGQNIKITGTITNLNIIFNDGSNNYPILPGLAMVTFTTGNSANITLPFTTRIGLSHNFKANTTYILKFVFDYCDVIEVQNNI